MYDFYYQKLLKDPEKFQPRDDNQIIEIENFDVRSEVC